jgi:hypothetical protein
VAVARLLLIGEGAALDLGQIFMAEAGRPLVVSDIDNTLCFQAEAVCTALNARFGTSRVPASLNAYPFGALLDPDERLWIARFTARDSWAACMAPDHEAITALNAIGTSGSTVAVASGRPPVIAQATTAWLDANGVQRDRDVLQGPGSKQAALSGCSPRKPGLLIDDDPCQWLTIARPGVQVWSPRRPWTPAGWQSYPNVRVFTSWSEPLSWLGAASSSTHNPGLRG